jgi:hypothetical protein
MANKKVKPSRDFYDFLPEPVQKSTKIKDMSDKNVLATLCFQHLSHIDYAREHDGWFYCTHQNIIEGTGDTEEERLSPAQLKRVLLKLEIKKLVQRKSGTTHHPTHYKLHPAIVKLLPVIETVKSDNNANEPQLEVITNEPHIEKSSIEIPNEPQDKIRQVKTSQVKTSLNVTSNTVDVVSKAAFEDAASQQQDLKEIFKQWRVDTDNAKSFEELIQIRDEFIKTVKGMGGIPKELEPVFETYRNHYDWRRAALRH